MEVKHVGLQEVSYWESSWPAVSDEISGTSVGKGLKGEKMNTVTQAFCSENHAKEESFQSCVALKPSWAGILLISSLSLLLPVLPSPLRSQPWIHSQAVSVHAACCSENANTFSVMNIWETPVGKRSSPIPSVLLAVTAEKQAPDRIRKRRGKKA